MSFYIDIQIKPDAEIRENVLMNKVYSKLHKALFDLNANNVGVSFPKWKVMLGTTLRLHSTQESLDALQKINWLGGLSGYCEVSGILNVPGNCKYRVISRIQTTMTPAKLRRLLKRGTITNEEAKAYKAKMFTKGLDEPYLELESGSNGNKHRRYISFGQLVDTNTEGAFDSFGLSKTATIPWF